MKLFLTLWIFLIPKNYLPVDPASSIALLRHSEASKSSKASKRDSFLSEEIYTYGSELHDLIVSREIPELSMAFPNLSFVISLPIQLALSAKASKGEALPWNPFSPTFGFSGNPKSFQFFKQIFLKDPSSASFGSVVPRTLVLKSAQESID